MLGIYAAENAIARLLGILFPLGNIFTKLCRSRTCPSHRSRCARNHRSSGRKVSEADRKKFVKTWGNSSRRATRSGWTHCGGNRGKARMLAERPCSISQATLVIHHLAPRSRQSHHLQ